MEEFIENVEYKEDLYGLAVISHDHSQKSPKMLPQIFANNSKNIISMGKTSCSLQKDEVTDRVEFSTLCKKHRVVMNNYLPYIKNYNPFTANYSQQIVYERFKKITYIKNLLKNCKSYL